MIPKFLAYGRMVPLTKGATGKEGRVYLNKNYGVSTMDRALRTPIQDQHRDKSHGAK